MITHPDTLHVRGVLFRKTVGVEAEVLCMGKPDGPYTPYRAAWRGMIAGVGGESVPAILRLQSDANGPAPHGVERWTFSCMGFDVADHLTREEAVKAALKLARERSRAMNKAFPLTRKSP